MIKTRLLSSQSCAAAAAIAARRLRRRRRRAPSTDPASFAPAGLAASSSKATVQPERRAEDELEELAEHGRRDRRPRRADRLRARTARPSDDGEPFDLRGGNRALARREGGVFFEQLRRRRLRPVSAIALETTDTDGAQDFIDKQAEASDEPSRTAPTRGRLQVDGDDDRRGRRRRRLPRRRRGREGLQGRGRRLRGRLARRRRRLRRGDRGRPDGSLADVYVDVGGLIEQSGRRDRPAGARSSSRARGHRPERSDRGRQPRPGLRPGRDRHQQRPRRRGSAERRRRPSCSARCRPTRSPPFGVADFGDQLEAKRSTDSTRPGSRTRCRRTS